MIGADCIAVVSHQHSNGRVQEALVSGDAEVAIVCSRIDDGWEPLFAVVDKEVKSLPSFFALNDEAAEELNRLVVAVEGSSHSSSTLGARASGQAHHFPGPVVSGA